MQYPATTITSFWFDLIHWAVGVLALHHDINVVLPICSEFSFSSTGGGGGGWGGIILPIGTRSPGCNAELRTRRS